MNNSIKKKKHSMVFQLLRVTEHFAFEINKRRNSVMLLNLKMALYGTLIYYTSYILYSYRLI